MNFVDWFEKNKNPDNMLTPSLEPQEAVNILIEYLLGNDWYVTDPLCNGQVNTIAVDEILYKYSKRYRKEVRKHNKKIGR